MELNVATIGQFDRAPFQQCQELLLTCGDDIDSWRGGCTRLFIRQHNTLPYRTLYPFGVSPMLRIPGTKLIGHTVEHEVPCLLCKCCIDFGERVRAAEAGIWGKCAHMAGAEEKRADSSRLSSGRRDIDNDRHSRPNDLTRERAYVA